MKVQSSTKQETPTESNSKLQDVFSLFCGTNEMRPFMLNPFVVGDKTYATDAYTLVRCDNDKINFEFENNEKLPNVESAVPKPNTSEIIDIDSIDWHSLMTKEEMIGGGQDLECGNCMGEGMCDDVLRYKDNTYHYEYECPVCDGSGYEREQKQIPTGNKTFVFYDLVDFKGIYFRASLFHRLKKVKDLIGGDVELVYYEIDRDVVMFRIGIVEILLMRCGSTSDECVVASID